jgi:hypothetical protein
MGRNAVSHATDPASFAADKPPEHVSGLAETAKVLQEPSCETESASSTMLVPPLMVAEHDGEGTGELAQLFSLLPRIRSNSLMRLRYSCRFNFRFFGPCCSSLMAVTSLTPEL